MDSMAAQKRPVETTTPPSSPPPALEKGKAVDSLQGNENRNQKQPENNSDSDGGSSSSDGEQDEFIAVNLAELRKEFQCPICLGIIRKTRTVMECLHRFCRECIDKSMRLGNNECPSCRTHCASRRSLRDDPNYDALIAVLYPDIDKYEEEEMAFQEEEMARNKQIQDSIAETFRRQAEAVGKKRTPAGVPSRRRNLRGRRNHRVVEHQGSGEVEEANGHDRRKDSSSTEERSTEVKLNGELLGAASGCPGSTEILAWGSGGTRSNNQHGGPSGSTDKLSVDNRIPNLTDCLESSNENDAGVKISLTLISLDEKKIPALKPPSFSCCATQSIKHLCQYIAMQTSMEASEIELLLAKNYDPANNPLSLKTEPGILNTSNDELQLLNEDQILGEIHASAAQPSLVLAYRHKMHG